MASHCVHGGVGIAGGSQVGLLCLCHRGHVETLQNSLSPLKVKKSGFGIVKTERATWYQVALLVLG